MFSQSHLVIFFLLLSNLIEYVKAANKFIADTFANLDFEDKIKRIMAAGAVIFLISLLLVS